MKPSRALIFGIILILTAAPIAFAVVQAYQQYAVWPSGQLTHEEKTRARALAEQELLQPQHDIAPNEKIFFTKIDLLPDIQAETANREVIVTHYRYQGNEAVLTYVDLNANAVFKIERVANLPTPLAEEEFQLACSLARADSRLTHVFAEYEDALQIEAKPQPQRNVHLLFRVGRDYLSGPRVIVDLVSESVRVEKVD